MAATPLAERPTALKVLGIGFVVLMLFFVWLTYAFFNKTFERAEMVTLQTSKSGSNLPMNADVKLRGMIVGSVRSIEPSDQGVTMQLAIKPEYIDRIPADVTADIIPKTLFGEKYISLIAAEGAGPDSESLKAGDTITRAEVPIEVEDLLNDLYPLLQAVEPADLSYTLTAMAQALEGRGEKLGETLVTANDYLKEINPDVPVLVDDLVKLGEVSDIYAKELPTVARLLRNSVTTGNTLVAKRTELAAFFDEGTRLADTLTEFVAANADDLEALGSQSREILQVSAKYSSTFPCFLGGMATSVERLDSVLRNRTVHIDLKTLATQPTQYEEGEEANLPDQAVIDSSSYAQPTGPNSIEQVCESLPQYSNETGPDGYRTDAGNPSGSLAQDKVPFNVPPEVYTLVGLTNSHNSKFGEDEDFERAAAASLGDLGYWSPSLANTDSEQQRDQVRQLAAAMAGVEASDVPDAASLLLSPVLRGAEVQAP
ncbi:MCE family protein [Aeromicrobium sp. CTD01-1L150]|uniref:MCE family protein n=1 Tax=Aeromicrobium sp. CTD01-1L150 TaxID=3341830 RepID=UPI0035C20657